MGLYKNMAGGVPSDKQVNSKFQELLRNQLKSLDADGEDVKPILHEAPPTSSSKSGGLFSGGMMDFTTILEALDTVAASMDDLDSSDDVMDEPIDADEGVEIDYDALLGELNKIFTPVLITQNLEKDISDKTNAELSESNMLNEKTIIAFDNESRLSQLVSACAQLIARFKNSKQWQVYAKAKALAKQAKIDMQKREFPNAMTLAQKYLLDVSSNNGSSIARDAAKELLPLTTKR